MAASEDVELLESLEAFQGHVRIKRLRLRHRQFAGGLGPALTREVVYRSDAVAVLPYDPVRDEVVLIEQFRIGPYVRGDADPWLIEIVAGLIEASEAPDEVARRECVEEAGLQLAELVPVLGYYASPGLLCEHISVYCGRVETTEAGGIHGLDHEGEDIRVLVRSFDEAMALLREGRISAGPAVVALQWLALNRDDLRRRWSGG